MSAQRELDNERSAAAAAASAAEALREGQLTDARREAEKKLKASQVESERNKVRCMYLCSLFVVLSA